MFLILGGLVLVSIVAFAMTFLFWSSRLGDSDNLLALPLALVCALFGPVLGYIGLLFLMPFLPEAFVTMTIPLSVPAVVCPWLSGALGCAFGDMARIERQKDRKRKE